jgi:hypothetical protein
LFDKHYIVPAVNSKANASLKTTLKNGGWKISNIEATPNTYTNMEG